MSKGSPSSSDMESSHPTPSPLASGQQTPIGCGSIPAISVDGYRLFSSFISSDPLRSTTIFRRFDRLAIRNLLYLESEVAALENELERLDQGMIPESMINHLGDWNILKAEAEYAEEDTSENVSEETAKAQELMISRMRLVKKIRLKIKEYHEALKLASEIFLMKHPDHDDIQTNGRILVQAEKEDFDHWQDKVPDDSIIQGPLSTHLCDEHKEDLCTLAPLEERDPLTRLVESKHQLRRIITNSNGMIDKLRWQRMNKAITWISVFLVVGWLVGAIIGLYYWHSDEARLILLSVLTLGFAISVLLLTTARRHDVYSATAAYAAVLVVFVGTTLDGNGGGSGGGGGTTTASKTRLLRRLEATRTYTAASHDDGFDVRNSSTVVEVMRIIMLVGIVLLCASGLLALRRRRRIRL